MFVKSNKGSGIEVASTDKSRLVVIRSAEQYVNLKNKLMHRPHLELDKERSSHEVFSGSVYSLTNSKYKTKNTPYNIRGKILKLDMSYNGPQLTETTATRTDSFALPEYKELDDYVSSFVDSKSFYKSKNLIYKSGILLYGFPGNGKSSWIRHLMNANALPSDTVFVWCTCIPSEDMIQEFRKVDSFKVFIFEELTSSLMHSTEVRSFLTFMDGESSLDNTIYIATTNYPEQLPQNVIERPGRFDLIKEIDNPNEETREVILKQYFGEEFQDNMIRVSKGLSHAEIMYAFILAKKHQVNFDKAVTKLKDHKEFVRNGFEKYRKIGFQE